MTLGTVTTVALGAAAAVAAGGGAVKLTTHDGPSARSGSGARAARAVVVVPAERPALVAAARALVARTPGAQLRVPRTAAEQLGVVHLLAAARSTRVIAAGLDARVAVAPVRRAYPDSNLTEVRPLAGALARALAASH